ncbi:MAG: RsmD family RNA methyltransferase [Paracoccaceae bacterium]
MRIVGGENRGLRLAPLGRGDPAAALRPTPDRVREALFSALASLGHPDGGRVLDLFAGTGALGLEALSRGASHATFVESGRAGQRLIARNLELTRRAGQGSVIARPAARLGPGEACSLIFLDPPYGRGLGGPALAAARTGGWIAPGALVAWEEAAPMPAPEGFATLQNRRYGDSHVTLLRADGPPD